MLSNRHDRSQPSYLGVQIFLEILTPSQYKILLLNILYNTVLQSVIKY